MNKYLVTFNFTTGKYDVIRLEDMMIVSSDHEKYTEAKQVMEQQNRSTSMDSL